LNLSPTLIKPEPQFKYGSGFNYLDHRGLGYYEAWSGDRGMGDKEDREKRLRSNMLYDKSY
jgi:hypothetical protein